jgi:predicted Zn-dependent protease
MNGNPAFSPLLIINPLSGEGLQALFRTHPSTQERVSRLLEMAKLLPTNRLQRKDKIAIDTFARGLLVSAKN